MIYLALAILLLWTSPSFSKETEVVQQAARTTTGTQDFTSAGFGTPKAVMCMAGFGATNGTAVSHGIFSIGFSDGTRQNALSVRTKNGVTTTLTGRRADTTDILLIADQDQTVIMRVQFSAWITDGVRLNYSVAPATGYQVSCTLFGGAGISNAYVNTVSTPATVDTSTTVNTVGFQADLIIGGVNGDGTYSDSNQAQGDLSVGFALRGGSQKSVRFFDVTGVTTTALVSRNLSNRIGQSGSNAQQIEIQNFTSSGFDATTRGAAAAATLGYLALRFNGITANVMAVDSPTATGSQSISGIGFTPQWGMLVGSSMQVIDTNVNDTDAEAWGISSFTASAQSCFAIASADGVTTSVTESLTDTKPICLRKSAGVFYSASFTSFGSGTTTFNYATADGTTRKWIGLFLQQVTTGSAVGRRRVQ